MFLPSADRYRLFQYAVVIGFGSAGDFWSSSAAQSSSVAVGVSLHASPILTWQFGSGAPRSSSAVFGSYASDDSVLDLNVCSPGPAWARCGASAACAICAVASRPPAPAKARSVLRIMMAPFGEPACIVNAFAVVRGLGGPVGGVAGLWVLVGGVVGGVRVSGRL